MVRKTRLLRYDDEMGVGLTKFHKQCSTKATEHARASRCQTVTTPTPPDSDVKRIFDDLAAVIGKTTQRHGWQNAKKKAFALKEALVVGKNRLNFIVLATEDRLLLAVVRLSVRHPTGSPVPSCFPLSFPSASFRSRFLSYYWSFQLRVVWCAALNLFLPACSLWLALQGQITVYHILNMHLNMHLFLVDCDHRARLSTKTRPRHGNLSWMQMGGNVSLIRTIHTVLQSLRHLVLRNARNRTSSPCERFVQPLTHTSVDIFVSVVVQNLRSSLIKRHKNGFQGEKQRCYKLGRPRRSKQANLAVLRSFFRVRT